MKATATNLADSYKSNASKKSNRTQALKESSQQIADEDEQYRSRNAQVETKRPSLASNSSGGAKRVTFNQLTSQNTAKAAQGVKDQKKLQATPDVSIGDDQHNLDKNNDGAAESPSSLKKNMKKQQIKTVKINSKISQRDSANQAGRKPAVLNSREMQSSMVKEQQSAQPELGLDFLISQPEEYSVFDDLDDEAFYLLQAEQLEQRQKRRKVRFQARIQLMKSTAAADAQDLKDQQAQHDGILIVQSPQNREGQEPAISVEAAPSTPAPPLAHDTVQNDADRQQASNYLNLKKDTSMEKEASIISEVDQAFEEQTPNHRDQSRSDVAPAAAHRPSQPELATFSQEKEVGLAIDSQKSLSPDKSSTHERKGAGANRVETKPAGASASRTYEHLLAVDSAKPTTTQKTPLYAAGGSSAQNSQVQNWNFNIKSKIKRMQTVGQRQPQKGSSNKHGILSKSPLKQSPSIKSKGVFTAFDIESALSRQKQTTTRHRHGEESQSRGGRFRRDEDGHRDRNGSSLNLTVDNHLDQLSLNIGKVTGPLRNALRHEQQLSSEGRQLEYDAALASKDGAPGQGTFSMLSSGKGKSPSPFAAGQRGRKRSNEANYEIIASSSFRKNKMIISSGPVAKRSSTMRQQAVDKNGVDVKGSAAFKRLDQRSQLSDQDVMKRSGGVGSAQSKYEASNVAFEDDEIIEFPDTDDVVRQRIENSNKKMMAVYTRNPYKVQSIDAIKQLEKQHSGQQQLQKQTSLSRSKRDKMQKLFRAENHLKIGQRRQTRNTALHSPKLSSVRRQVMESQQDGLQTARNRPDIFEDGSDQSAHLLSLLQRLQESDSNQGAVEKEFRLCLYAQVEAELEKRARLLSAQVTWLRKQKQLCEVYGQSLSHVVHAITQVPTDLQRLSQDSAGGGRPKRLKNLNAELLKPVSTLRRREEQIVALHDPTGDPMITPSILAESVTEAREIVDIRQNKLKEVTAISSGQPSAMVQKRHSEQIRDQVTPQHMLTSSLNSNSMFHQSTQKEPHVQIAPIEKISAMKGANQLLHQLVGICQRLKYSPDKVSYLRSLLRQVDLSEYEIRKLLKHTYRKKSPGHLHRRSVDQTNQQLPFNFLDAPEGRDEGHLNDNEIRFYKLSLIQLNRLIKANQKQSSMVKVDPKTVSSAAGSHFNSFRSKDTGIGKTSGVTSPPIDSSRNHAAHVSYQSKKAGEEIIDYFDRKLMERKSLETNHTKFGTSAMDSGREEVKALVKRTVDEDSFEQNSKDAVLKTSFAEDSVGDVKISHSHKMTIQKYRKRRKDAGHTASVSKDGGIDFIKENKRNLLPFFTTMKEQEKSVSQSKDNKTPQKHPSYQDHLLRSQKVNGTSFTQSNCHSPVNNNRATKPNRLDMIHVSQPSTQRNSRFQNHTRQPSYLHEANSDLKGEHKLILASSTNQAIKVRDNKTSSNCDVQRQFVPDFASESRQNNLNQANSNTDQSPIRSRKMMVQNEVRASRHKLIQSGHQIVCDQSHKKNNSLNFQLKHVSQKIPASWMQHNLGPYAETSSKLPNVRERSDYISSSIAANQNQLHNFQSSKQSQMLQSVLTQQRELNRGMRNTQHGVTQAPDSGPSKFSQYIGEITIKD